MSSPLAREPSLLGFLRPFAVLVVAFLVALALPAGVANAQSRATSNARGRPGVDSLPPLERPVTVDLRDVTVHQALNVLRDSARIDFNYEDLVLDTVPQRVTFRGVHTRLARALAYILRGTGLVATPYEATIVIIKPAPPASIRGRVVDSRTGEGVAGATVVLDDLWHRAASRDNGAYHLDSVPIGTFRVSVRRLGYDSVSRMITVAASSHQNIELALDQISGNLQRVVVTGTVVPTPVKELPTPISVVTSTEVQDQHYSRVDDIFRGRVPGAISWRQGNVDYYSTITVRGINSLDVNNIKTYIDGVEVADYGYAAVDPNSIERIEVIRGPEASTIYGSDASGGVMEIFTKHGEGAPDHPSVSASLAEGIVQNPSKLAGTLQQNYTVGVNGAFISSASRSEASYSLGASYRHVGAWIPGYYSSDPGAYGGLHLGHRSFSIDLSGRYLERDFPAITSPALVATNIPALSAPQNVGEQVHEETYGVRIHYEPTAWWRHSLTLGDDRSELSYARTAPQFADSGLSVFDQATAKASIAYNTSLSGDISALHAVMTLGFDHYNKTIDGAGASQLRSIVGTLADTLSNLRRERVSNTGVFGQTQLGFHDQLFLTMGVRADNNSGIGPIYGYAWAPRFGISFVPRLGDVTLKARAAYGEGIQPGLPSERLAQQLAFGKQLASGALAPERQVGGDFGFDLIFGHVASLSVTYYDQQARDLIQDVLLKSDSTGITLQFQNIGQINNRGLETQASLTEGGIRLDAEFSYTSSKIAKLPPLNEYTGDYRVGDQALAVPLTSGGITLSSHPWRGGIVAMGTVFVGPWTSYNYPSLDSAIYANKPLTSTRPYWMRFPAFVKVRMSIDQELRTGVSGFLAIDNLTNDRSTEQNALFAVPGRTTSIGVRLAY